MIHYPDVVPLNIPPIDSKSEKKRRSVEDEMDEEDWRKVNFTRIPEGEEGPGMVPKPWW